MLVDLQTRTEDACDQLTRYGGAVFNQELADVLDSIVEINDNLHNGRHKDLIIREIEKAKTMLGEIAEKTETDFI